MEGRVVAGKIFRAVFAVSFFFGAYANFEPEIAAGAAGEDLLNVAQDVTSEITVSSPANVTMSADIPGIAGGSAIGSAAWIVKTNDTSGFSFKIRSDAVNCLRNGPDYFKDYTEFYTGIPDYSWIRPITSAFGYTVEPATVEDTAPAFRDNGSACGTGNLNTSDKCWDGFSIADATVINRSTLTSAAGEAELVKFRSELAAGQYLPEGNYIATITVTVTTN